MYEYKWQLRFIRDSFSLVILNNRRGYINQSPTNFIDDVHKTMGKVIFNEDIFDWLYNLYFQSWFRTDRLCWRSCDTEDIDNFFIFLKTRFNDKMFTKALYFVSMANLVFSQSFVSIFHALFLLYTIWIKMESF